jgi:hypothetical protein
MSSRKIPSRKIIFGAACSLALVGATATAVLASTTETTPDNLVATVIGNLKAGTKLTFNGTVNGLPITVTCTTFHAQGTLPNSGLTATIAPPTISGCTDTIGGTDTVKTNQTNGKWQVTFVDSASETAAEPNSGDQVQLVIPKAGAVFTDSVLSGCTITAAPTGPAPVTGTYNDVNTDSVSKASIPVSATGCTATAASATGTVVISPNIHDGS